MYRITEKRELNEAVALMKIEAPRIANKAKSGQFIILRIDDHGERIPLTIAGTDPQTGEVTIVFQKVGLTTSRLYEMQQGDSLLDFVGPLGVPSHTEGFQRVAVVGGGLGIAIAWPQAKGLHQAGAQVDLIAGFRTKDLVILEQELKDCCTNFYLCTDDGSYGTPGFVTEELKRQIEAGVVYDLVVAIGPLRMMQAVAELTRPYGIKTIVSMNPIMIDGTGMCGCCRLTVGGETKFACVDGPDFDGHLVDFEEAIRRNNAYREQEQESLQRHICNLTGEVRD